MAVPRPDFEKPSPKSPESVGAVEIVVADGYSAFDMQSGKQVGPGETAFVHPKALKRHPEMDCTPRRSAKAHAKEAKSEGEGGPFGPDLTKKK